MIDHVSVSVEDYKRNLSFYDATLALLGYKRVMTIDIPENQVKCAGYGKGEKPYFWVSPMGKQDELIGKARGVHIAFSAPDRAAVDAWYNACIKLGGQDNGKPGLRPHYHPEYYGAFIIDLNGWRIEGCCHHK